MIERGGTRHEVSRSRRWRDGEISNASGLSESRKGLGGVPKMRTAYPPVSRPEGQGAIVVKRRAPGSSQYIP